MPCVKMLFGIKIIIIIIMYDVSKTCEDAFTVNAQRPLVRINWLFGNSISHLTRWKLAQD